jgi:hypothetical protein
MSEPSAARSTGSWVDAIFGGLRAATQKLASSQEWLGRAERSKAVGWRATFVLAARDDWAAATRALGDVESQLGSSGTVRAGEGLAPIEQLQANIATMRTKLQDQEKALGAAISALAGAAHRGSA